MSFSVTALHWFHLFVSFNTQEICFNATRFRSTVATNSTGQKYFRQFVRGFSLIHPARDGIITSYGIRPLVVQVCNIKTLSVMKILLECDVSMRNADYCLAFIEFMHILFVLPSVEKSLYYTLEQQVCKDGPYTHYHSYLEHITIACNYTLKQYM